MHGGTLRSGAAIAVAGTLLATLAACGSDDDKPDPMAGQQWGLNAMKLPDAWKTSKGKDVVIAAGGGAADGRTAGR